MSNANGRSGLLYRLAPWVLVLGLVAFHAINNWIWLTDNVVIPGWDRPAHLGRSLAYYASLTPLTWQGLFTASVQDPIRPPFFFASATPLYWAFGTSSDVATMVNVGYWLILLVSVYGLGTHLGGRRLGIWGAVLAALLPMLYAMSRSFYIEFALTALVALTLYLLVASRGFQRREATLAFGVVLGLGMLTKRTYPLFVAVPLLVAVLKSDVLPRLWQRLRAGLRISWPDLLVAVGSGVVLAALWYLPNRVQARDLALGWWLFAAWTILVAATIYLLLRRPKDPAVNFLSALGLGAGLASLWYLPRVDVIRRLLLYGYGVGDPRGRELNLGSIYTYTYYPRYTVNEGLGLVFSLLLAAVVIGGGLWLVRKGRWRQAWRADAGWWILVLWPLGAYLLLTFSIYKEARALLPILPGLALLLAAGLVRLPWRRTARLLLGLALAWGLVQFAVVSFARFHEPAQKTQFWSPLLGEAGLFAVGDHIELPDAGPTAPGYNIQPDVLMRVDARRRLMEQPTVRLGVLAQTPQINAGSFLYSTLTRYPNVQVAELARNYENGDPLPHLFGYEYLLLKRDNQDADELAQVAIDRILDGSVPLFGQAFVLEASYALPDGDTAYLYHLRYWPDASLPEEYVAEAEQYLATAASADDALLLNPPALLSPLSREGLAAAELHLLADTEQVRTDLPHTAAEHRRLFVLYDRADPSDAGAMAESWLNEHAYRAEDRWFGSLQLVLYGTTPLPPAQQATKISGARFGNGIELTGIDLPGQKFRGGEIVPLTLFWQTHQPIPENLKVFVHLLRNDGQLVAQRDSEPVSGERPTSSWLVDETIVDRHGISLPAALRPGAYRLVVGLYDPDSEERLPVTARGEAPNSDFLQLGVIHIEP